MRGHTQLQAVTHREDGARGAAGAFTLIEILVVIAVIAILVSVVVAVGSAMRAGAQRNQTAATLKILSGLLDKYRTENNKIDFVDMNGFINNVAQFKDMATVLQSLNTYTPASSVAPGYVNDGFGNAIFFVRYNSTVSGQAQSGTSNTVVISASDSAGNGFYSGYTIYLTSGPGAGQSSTVSGYVNTSKTATISGTWSTSPTSSTTYALVPSSPVLAARAPYFQSYGPDGVSSSDDIFSYDSP